MAYMTMENFIDDDELQDYPYNGVFYTTEIDRTKPLDEQEEEEVVILECKCDITESSHAASNGYLKSSYTVYVPFCKKCDSIIVNRGNLFRAWQDGILIKGKVEGVFPSQLGGFTCYIRSDEIEND